MLVIGITAVAVATSSSHWLAGPHFFSLTLMLVWYQALDDYQLSHRNTLIYFPPLMLLWVNLHGRFVIGLLLLVIYASGNFFRSLTAPPIRSSIRTVITFYSFRLSSRRTAF